MPQKHWRKPRLPPQLAEILRAKASVDPKARWLIRTDAKCTNQKLGSLFARFLFQELNSQDRRAFERHVGSCIHCAAMVHVAFELRKDDKRASTPRSE